MNSIFEDLVSLKEGAELLKKDESTIRRHILNGNFRIGYDCKKFGKQWVFRLKALEKFYLDDKEGADYMMYDSSVYNIMNIIKCNEDKEYFELLFNLIDRSLINNRFNSKNQDSRFEELLIKESSSDISNMFVAFAVLNKELYKLIDSEEFSDKLCEIGIGGDDSFNDFSVWIIAQGKEVVNKVFVYGIDYILEYIKENDISKENYKYEGLLIYSLIQHTPT